MAARYVSRKAGQRLPEEGSMPHTMRIAARPIGTGHPVYVIAELSANHHQDFDQAAKLIEVAKQAGADAVKLQLYTADSLTLPSGRPEFRIGGGTLWDGETLHSLYQKAYTPWDWFAPLKRIADQAGITFFASAFDAAAIDRLESLDVPAHKVASFELVDHGLITAMARTGKPLIMSTGMATLAEIDEAVTAARTAGVNGLALLKCCSNYPAASDTMHLRSIPHLAGAFACPVGLSDHTLGYAVPVAAIALGATILEKHLTLSRSMPGPDSSFSLEPAEFAAMAAAVRDAEKALGHVHYGPTSDEMKSRQFRRSLFVTRDMAPGEAFAADNVRSIRPAHGLPPKHLPEILGRRAAVAISAGTPLDWSLIDHLHPADRQGHA
jgi:N-acetylneuraminate synthase